MTRIAHIMTPEPETVPPDVTIDVAARRMMALGLRHLPVVDGGGRLVGIVSDRDLRGPLLYGDAPPGPSPAQPIDTVMTTDILVAGADDEVGQVARRIVDRRVGAVPIVAADGRLVGIVSYVDVLRRLAEEAEADARAVALMD
ncbi:MAG: CBS domain-containing protein [Kofleriaceae bacterium]|jgi:CBS domain-containing protein|nr:CBS domain-containing protein [Kofleriaceae bacterium]MBP9171458.1 CBS domain-containing protein [Kofleriaceae bacterium]MBP9861963.1 CBS domain-containing protein [Kofleriaceae bacterium]